MSDLFDWMEADGCLLIECIDCGGAGGATIMHGGVRETLTDEPHEEWVPCGACEGRGFTKEPEPEDCSCFRYEEDEAQE